MRSHHLLPINLVRPDQIRPLTRRALKNVPPDMLVPLLLGAHSRSCPPPARHQASGTFCCLPSWSGKVPLLGTHLECPHQTEPWFWSEYISIYPPLKLQKFFEDKNGILLPLSFIPSQTFLNHTSFCQMHTRLLVVRVVIRKSALLHWQGASSESRQWVSTSSF